MQWIILMSSGNTMKPPKILFIDDDPSVCEILKRLLTPIGYEVSTSNDIQEGLFLARSQFFNVIILSIFIPGTDGLTPLSKLKSFTPDSEVIMINGYCWDFEAIIQSFKLGTFDYLKKPIDPNFLYHTVRNALEKQALKFEKRYLISEIEFKNMLLEEQRNLLEDKLIEDDQKIFRLAKKEVFTRMLFEEMIESLPLGAMVIDKEGWVIICNNVQEIFSGISRNSLLGKNLFQDTLPIDLKPWQEMGKNFLNSKCYEVKVVDQRPTKERVLSITLSSLVDEIGDCKGFIFLSADITNEKRIEEHSIQSEKMTAIGQLVTSLAHQIRNPLAIIGSATQYCIEKVGYEKNGLKKYFEIIYRNINNANKIIIDLLDFAKPKRLEFKKHDINQLLEEICKLIKVDFQKNRIRILKRFDTDVLKILCDKESLKQVFFNLLMNSKQAMPEGGVVCITTKYNYEDQKIHIIVKDTGNGIPKEHLPNIFNPYFTTKEKGTGLGLSIVHRIISDHHGNIIPESKEGKGTKMTITLPIKLINPVVGKTSTPKLGKVCQVLVFVLSLCLLKITQIVQKIVIP
jgi:PAS domain S-box-containing protein